MNDAGLKARFYYDGHQAVTEVEALPRFEGYQGVYHGGIISTLLDEVMIKALLADDKLALTAEISVRFFRPVKTGQKIKFVGRLTHSKGRMFVTEGTAMSESGEVLATATGKYMEADETLRRALGVSGGGTRHHLMEKTC